MSKGVGARTQNGSSRRKKVRDGQGRERARPAERLDERQALLSERRQRLWRGRPGRQAHPRLPIRLTRPVHRVDQPVGGEPAPKRVVAPSRRDDGREPGAVLAGCLSSWDSRPRAGFSVAITCRPAWWRKGASGPQLAQQRLVKRLEFVAARQGRTAFSPSRSLR